MHVFKDRDGKDWTIDVNVNTLKRVKSALDVDLMELVSDTRFVDRLTADPCLLVDILYVICQPQCLEAGISDEQFGRRMAGDAIEDATGALLGDFVDFFPGRKREILRNALAKLKAVENRILDLAQATLDDPKLDDQLEAALAKLGDPQAAA